MASNYTQNLGLCQWEAEDAVLREDFNADNAKLDELLASVPKIVFGTYRGNGAASQFINLGFTPSAVFVNSDKGRTYEYSGTYCYGGLALNGYPIQSESGTKPVEIVDGGFTVAYSASNSAIVATNQNFTNFYYAAFA